MKQISTIVFTVLMTVAVWVAATPVFDVKYECMYEADKVSSIAIYELNEDSVEVIDETIEPYRMIKESEYSGFLNGIESLPFENEIILLPIPLDYDFSYYGYVVKIVYDDGAYEIISANGVQEQVDTVGENKYTHYSCDKMVWFKYISQNHFDE